MSAEIPKTPDDRLRSEFNRWAEAGRGEEMERHHLSITEQTIRLMELRPGERVWRGWWVKVQRVLARSSALTSPTKWCGAPGRLRPNLKT